MTRSEFIAATGREPEQDDLERANCWLAGYPGHMQCGVCEHDRPLFECAVCIERRSRGAI